MFYFFTFLCAKKIIIKSPTHGFIIQLNFIRLLFKNGSSVLQTVVTNDSSFGATKYTLFELLYMLIKQLNNKELELCQHKCERRTPRNERDF